MPQIFLGGKFFLAPRISVDQRNLLTINPLRPRSRGTNQRGRWSGEPCQGDAGRRPLTLPIPYALTLSQNLVQLNNVEKRREKLTKKTQRRRPDQPKGGKRKKKQAKRPKAQRKMGKVQSSGSSGGSSVTLCQVCLVLEFWDTHEVTLAADEYLRHNTDGQQDYRG